MPNSVVMELPIEAAAAVIPLARPVQGLPVPLVTAGPALPYRPLPRTHPAAVASAVCGFTALVPIICQVAGIALGILAIARINRDRRDGIATRGTGLAIAGISFSAVALAGWILLAVAMAGVSAAFNQIDTGLGGALP